MEERITSWCLFTSLSPLSTHPHHLHPYLLPSTHPHHLHPSPTSPPLPPPHLHPSPLFTASSLHLTTMSNLVEMNPDTSAKSDRPEWCYVHYDHTYNHKRAFQFEFQWVAATPCLFYQLVSGCNIILITTPLS